MSSIWERLSTQRENFTDVGWKKYLSKLVDEYKTKNYYETMGIPGEDFDAEKGTLKKNYRQLARLLHPDKSTGKVYKEAGTELFKLIRNTYEILSDESKNTKYRISIKASKSSLPKTKRKSEPESEPRTTKSATTPDAYSKSSFPGKKYKSGPRATNVNFFDFDLGGVFVNGKKVHNGEKVHPGKKVISGDVKASENVNTAADDIHVKGDVFGKVSSMSGNIEIDGAVLGKVFTMSGNNTIKNGIAHCGSVVTMSGSNYISGKIEGKYSTISGKNYIN